jgi:hypothetical protein
VLLGASGSQFAVRGWEPLTANEGFKPTRGGSACGCKPEPAKCGARGSCCGAQFGFELAEAVYTSIFFSKSRL